MTSPSANAIVMEKLSTDEFAQKITRIVDDGFISLSLAVGTKLKLFHLLASVSNDDQGRQTPKTAQEIASAGNLKERYVREWCAGMVCAGLIECDESGEKFWFPQERLNVLHGPKSNLHTLAFLPLYADVKTKLENCFKNDGAPGLSYDDFTEFHSIMGAISKAFFEKHLLQDCLSLVPETLAQLHSGISCLDVGCGAGDCSRVLAENFPKSKFLGVDFSEEAIEKANRMSREKCFQQLQYLVMDAAELNADWSNSMDLVTAFDCIHDQAYPDRVLKEIARVLKPNGIFLMVDIIGTSNPAKDRDSENPMSNFLYVASLFHCMPVSLNFPGGVGLGAMWGVEKAKRMLKDAGFEAVQVLDMPFQQLNCLYNCKMPMQEGHL